MSRRAWKSSRPGRDTFPPRPSSGSTPVGTTDANTKALMGGDVGRGPAFRWTMSGRLPSFAATMSDSFVFCARPTTDWRPNMSMGPNSSSGRSMKGGGVGKCRSTGHRLLELRSGSLSTAYQGQPMLSAIRSLPMLPGRSFRSDCRESAESQLPLHPL